MRRRITAISPTSLSPPELARSNDLAGRFRPCRHSRREQETNSIATSNRANTMEIVFFHLFPPILIAGYSAGR